MVLLLVWIIYVLVLQDEQSIREYASSWLPRNPNGDNIEDPILKVLNSTDAPFNINLETNGIFDGNNCV